MRLIAIALTSVSLLMVLPSTAETVLTWKNDSPIKLSEGDLVFRKGQGLWTRYFINVSQREKRFSHVGIVVSNECSLCIIHAEANEWNGIGCVHLQCWNQFFSDALESAVFRYDGDDNVRRRIACEAKKMQHIPFDPLFDMDNTNRLYCTEFVRLAVNRALHQDLIGYTVVCGRPVVAIDDIYRKKFIRVFDSKRLSRKEMK